jgi:hypothetical protein
MRNGMPPATRPTLLSVDEAHLWTILEPCWNVEVAQRPNIDVILAWLDPSSTFPTFPIHLDHHNENNSPLNRFNPLNTLESDPRAKNQGHTFTSSEPGSLNVFRATDPNLTTSSNQNVTPYSIRSHFTAGMQAVAQSGNKPLQLSFGKGSPTRSVPNQSMLTSILKAQPQMHPNDLFTAQLGVSSPLLSCNLNLLDQDASSMSGSHPMSVHSRGEPMASGPISSPLGGGSFSRDSSTVTPTMGVGFSQDQIPAAQAVLRFIAERPSEPIPSHLVNERLVEISNGRGYCLIGHCGVKRVMQKCLPEYDANKDTASRMRADHLYDHIRYRHFNYRPLQCGEWCVLLVTYSAFAGFFAH